MPHAADDPTPLDPAAWPGRWVRCRSRTWRVLDARRDEEGVQWRLARGSDLPHVFASPPDTVTPLAVATQRVSRQAWMRHVLRVVRAQSPVWWPRLAPSLPLDRLPFQYVPSMAMLSGCHRRLLLADAVGLGKTMQAAMLLHEVHGREPDAATLVVTPAALLTQWQRELRLRTRIDASLLDADALRREASLPRRVVEARRRGACWLLSVDLLRQPEVTRLVTSVAWTLLVVDEAHLAAPGTARLEAVSRVAAVSVRVLLLTATPTAAGDDAAEALRRLGGRPDDPPMAVLCRHSTGAQRHNRRTCRLRIRSRAAEKLLHEQLDRYAARARVERGAGGLLPALVLRRRAASCPAAVVHSLIRRLDVMGTAPSLREPGLFDALPDDEGQEDEAMRAVAWRDEGEERRELERLLTLARSCDAAGYKGALIARLLRRCPEPVVIFTAYLDTLRTLRPLLAGHPLVVVHGGMPDALRVAAIDAFTSGDARVLLTTDASAEGINLHHRCRLVVHADVPSSARLFMQRTGRVDRHGQVRRVHAIVLVTTTAHDREALQRLQTRQDGDERWLAGAAPARCRRTGVAEQWLWRRGCGNPPSRLAAPVQVDAGPCVVTHRAGGPRWRRLARALTLPADARSLTVGILRIGGAPNLTQCESVVALSGTGDGAQVAHALAATTAWPALVRSRWIRARRLVDRLARWEAETAKAVQAEARAAAPSHDLFGDPRDDRGDGAPARSHDLGPSCAFSTIGVLERRP